MAMKLVERARKNWKAAKFSHLRASAYYGCEEYGRALERINAAISLYRKVPVPPLGAYFLRGMIRRQINFGLKMAHQRETFPIHRQPPLTEGPI